MRGEPERKLSDDIPPHSGETEHGGLDMPTLVKERIDERPAATTRADGLGAIVLLLGIVVAAAFVASIFPPPPVIEPAPEMFFAP
jgi:hypothetical protein